MKTGLFGVLLLSVAFFAIKALTDTAVVYQLIPFLMDGATETPPDNYSKFLYSIGAILPLIPFLIWNYVSRKKNDTLPDGFFRGLFEDDTDIQKYHTPRGFWKNPVNTIILAIVLPAATYGLGSELDMILHMIFPCDRGFFQLLDFIKPMGTTGDLLGAYFTLGLIAPLGEEIFFRGVILTAGVRKYRKNFYPIMVIIQGVIFGVFHFTKWQGFYAAPMGILLGYLRMRTGKLWAPFLVHSGNNIISIIFLYHISSLDRILYDSCEKPEHIAPFILFLSGFGLFVSILYVVKKSVLLVGQDSETLE